MEFRHHVTAQGLDWLEAVGFTDEGACHGFSTRLGGVSPAPWDSLNLGIGRGDDPERVRENCRRFCAAIGGADAERLVFSHQVHRADVRVCTLADAGKGLDRERDYEADGLMTDVPGLPLMIFSADCIPVLFYDPAGRVVAASHAGWRGTALGIVAVTLSRMEAVYGCRPADIRCAIGPGISRCCFETREDVPQAMRDALGAEAEDFIDPLPNGRFHVDLKGINRRWAEKGGVPPENIVISDDCTSCKRGLYWSHRHTGPARGSMAAVIQLNPETGL
ncbi:MAG: peptidoglycan editing factor PgeF [Clostridiales bacterium]|nr:peptidoglycan editing factor PgeF [Clostridiales bacterium]